MTTHIFKNKWRRTFFHFALSFCILIFTFSIFSTAHAATNISASDHWAWNDIVGWMDFYSPNTVLVTSPNLAGYASSSAGNISLDCSTCGSGNYQVINDGNGYVSGWGWNDVYGWISFCGGQGASSTCPGSVAYQVEISATTGDFSGFAWNDLIGWISFCGGQSIPTCPGNIAYKVNTSWRAVPKTASLDSSTFDTGVPGGANLNSILWQGVLPAGADVYFRIASSNNSAGPWNFVGPGGTGIDPDYYGPATPNISYPISYSLHNNQRYFRYRVILISNAAQTANPRVDDIVINWSP